ncbi:MAG: hypothetical protein NTU74_18925 [Deltaproteobacteria bacterium]|nr:hypothetical protein [Deltaproteobacteria bacterium]
MKEKKIQLPARDSLLFFAAWGGFLLFVWPRMFFATPEGIYAGERAIWGDWAGHLAGSAVFAFRPLSLWFVNHPLFYGQTYNYPFASSMISGLLMRSGVDRISAMILPSIVISLLLLLILYVFYLSILKSGRQACVAATLFFMSGGLGFIYYIQDILQTASLKTLLFPMREYTFLEDKGIFFRNVFPAELLPQRSFLIGLPVGLLLLWVLMRWLSTGQEKPSAFKFFAVGIPAGILMIIHTHTYMAIVILCLCLTLSNMKSCRQMLVFALGAGLVSLWLYTTLHGQSMPSRWFGWEWGWMSNNQRAGIFPLIKFWLMNWGLMLPLAVWGTFQIRYFRHPMVIGGWILFMLCNIIRFQPWNWDNSKLLTWSYLLLIIPVVGVLSYLWRDNRRTFKGIAIVLGGALIFSGGLELMRLVQSSQTTQRMWDASKIDMASNFQKILQPGETVLTDADHLNWVSSLAGGQILMGYRGWLWSYGIDYSEREKEIRLMYSGKTDAEMLFDKYHVRYAVFSPSARSDFGGNELLFMLKYKMIMKDSDTRVYDVRSSRKIN